MAFRFRKSFKILPGVRLNVSKSGFSTSVGPRGATYNIKHGKNASVNTGASSVNWTKIGCMIPVIGFGLLFFLGWLFNQMPKSPRYRHPVTVLGDGIHVRDMQTAESPSRIIGNVSIGDTLEIHSIGEWCRVTPIEGKKDFEGGASGYVMRKYLSIPDSTSQAIKAGKVL